MAMNTMTPMPSMDRSQAERLSKSWWVVLILGAVSAIAGIVVLSIDWTIITLSLFIGALFIIRGLLQAVSPPSVGMSRATNITVGIIGILVGLAVIFFPTISLFALAIFVGAFLVVWGTANIVTSIMNRHIAPHWWLSLITGIIAVPLGIVALVRPALSLSIVILTIGIWAILAGILEIALSFEIKNLPKMTSKTETKGEVRRIA